MDIKRKSSTEGTDGSRILSMAAYHIVLSAGGHDNLSHKGTWHAVKMLQELAAKCYRF